MDAAWFAPHFEFRFPLLGEMAVRSVRMTIRGALEPWHVMGEEGAAGGTVRYVDSSLERVEVKVNGLNDNRHVVTVNGRAIPLNPTGLVGEFVAGVRYRAWQPASALHPTIGVHAPLSFDLRRHLDGALARRLPVLRGPPWRAQLRHLPGECLRSRKPAPGALLPDGPYARTHGGIGATAESRVSVYARSSSYVNGARSLRN